MTKFVFGDDVMQKGTTVGDGATLSLGTAQGNHLLFRDIANDGDVVGYCDRTTRQQPGAPFVDIREYGYGTLNYGLAEDGSLDTIARNVYKSTEDNERISWGAQDVHVVMSAPLLDIFGPLLLSPWLDTSNTSFTITSDHFGYSLDVDLSEGSVIRTLPSIASLGDRAIGFKIRFYGYGAGVSANAITLTPGTGDKLNELDTNEAMTIGGGIVTEVEVDGAFANTWRVSSAGSGGSSSVPVGGGVFNPTPEVKTANFTAEVGGFYACDTTVAFTATLPVGAALYSIVVLEDHLDKWKVNPLTVDPGATTLDGEAGTKDFTEAERAILILMPTGWRTKESVPLFLLPE